MVSQKLKATPRPSQESGFTKSTAIAIKENTGQELPGGLTTRHLPVKELKTGGEVLLNRHAQVQSGGNSRHAKLRGNKASQLVSTRPLLSLCHSDGNSTLPVPEKKPSIKKPPKHPFSKEFSDATATYSDNLIGVADHELGLEHEKLVCRLRGGRNSEVDRLEADQLLSEAIEVAKDFKSVAAEKIAVTTINGYRVTIQETYTVQERIEQFRQIAKTCEAKIVQLSKDHDELIEGISSFVAETMEMSMQNTKSKHVHTLLSQLGQEIERVGEEELVELRKEKSQNRLSLQRLNDILQTMG